MRERCPDSIPLGSGYLKGYELTFNRFSKRWGGGVADVYPEPSRHVWGLLYSLSVGDLARLDSFEGVPGAYTRFEADIESITGGPTRAWVYQVRNKGPYSPPTHRYLSIIKAAAVREGFPSDYRAKLATIVTTDSLPNR
jgi:gamma-glutamylcyclotransferase